MLCVKGFVRMLKAPRRGWYKTFEKERGLDYSNRVLVHERTQSGIW